MLDVPGLMTRFSD
jgi:hypothetical protein